MVSDPFFSQVVLIAMVWLYLLRKRLSAIAVQYWRLIRRAIAWYTAQMTAWISVHLT